MENPAHIALVMAVVVGLLAVLGTLKSGPKRMALAFVGAFLWMIVGLGAAYWANLLLGPLAAFLAFVVVTFLAWKVTPDGKEARPPRR